MIAFALKSGVRRLILASKLHNKGFLLQNRKNCVQNRAIANSHYSSFLEILQLIHMKNVISFFF